jgi:hypothetical protein
LGRGPLLGELLQIGGLLRFLRCLRLIEPVLILVVPDLRAGLSEFRLRLGVAGESLRQRIGEAEERTAVNREADARHQKLLL